MQRPEPLNALQELARLIANDLEQRTPDGEKRLNYRLAVASALTLADQIEELSRDEKKRPSLRAASRCRGAAALVLPTHQRQGKGGGP
jgi:hypothetical protein